MPGKANFSIDEIGVRITSFMNSKIVKLANRLCVIGEKCIIEARENGSYIDRTSNLRNSMGYAVLIDGKVYQQGYSFVPGGGKVGEAQGKAFLADKIKDAPSSGVILIVTAGMNYAEYVEARGYNVLTSSQLLAKDLVRQMLIKVGFTIS